MRLSDIEASEARIPPATYEAVLESLSRGSAWLNNPRDMAAPWEITYLTNKVVHLKRGELETAIPVSWLKHYRLVEKLDEPTQTQDDETRPIPVRKVRGRKAALRVPKQRAISGMP